MQDCMMIVLKIEYNILQHIRQRDINKEGVSFSRYIELNEIDNK